MRKEFAESIRKEVLADSKAVFLTGDLGFMALENVRAAMKKRFINVGVSEQNMISLAAGLASQGLPVICYSIAPFAVFRPAEQIRLDVCLHNMNVKIVGNGGGYGYGIMGATHHAIEDLAVISSFQNMRCYIPFCNEDVAGAVAAMMKRKGPAYLRLGYGAKPAWLKMGPFAPVRKLAAGRRVTIACVGPVALNLLQALGPAKGPYAADLFVVGEFPLRELPAEFLDSVRKTGRLLIAEEHVSRGGLGEHLALQLLKAGIRCKVIHKIAVGYPGGLCGSQAYHQAASGLDSASLAGSIKELSK
jgi:transketolase